MRLNTLHALLAGIALCAFAGCQQNADQPNNELETQAARPRQSVKQARPSKYDGPFGLKMGLTLEQAKSLMPGLVEDDDEPGFYKAETVPVPHSDFDLFKVIFSKTSGLCGVLALGKEIPSGRAGHEVRNQFDRLDDALTSKYGEGESHALDNQSDAAEYWLLELLQKNRILYKQWPSELDSPFENDIEYIILQARAMNISTGYLILTYAFTNTDDCRVELIEEMNKGL